MSRRSSWSFSAGCIASLAVFALCLSARPTWAEGLVLTLTLPTQNTDGSAIPASGPGSYASTRAEWGSCAADGKFGVAAGEQVYTGTATTLATPDLTPGLWCARVYARTSACDAGPPCESAPTNAVSKTIMASGPVVSDPLVYQVSGVTDHFQLAPVGTVPLGTACDAAQSVNGRMAVPRAAVSWYGSVRPRVVVAVCQ